MLNPRLYSPDNVERARRVQIGVAILAAVLCAYMAFSTLTSMREVWAARRMLRGQKTKTVQLLRDAADLREQRVRQAPMPAGGVESFAVEFARSASAGGVKVESVTPNGVPAATEIKIGDAKLGTWNATRVRVQGRGEFTSVMDLVSEFSDPDLPVRLESFAFRSSGSAGDGAVEFNLLLTVYQQKGGTT